LKAEHIFYDFDNRKEQYNSNFAIYIDRKTNENIRKKKDNNDKYPNIYELSHELGLELNVPIRWNIHTHLVEKALDINIYNGNHKLFFAWSIFEKNFMPFIAYNPFSIYEDSIYKEQTWFVFPRIKGDILKINIEINKNNNMVNFYHSKVDNYKSLFQNMFSKLYPHEKFNYIFNKELNNVNLFPFWEAKIEIPKEYFGVDIEV